MRGLQALAWRSLLARPLRSVLTLVGVALGVAVLVAGLATNAGMSNAVDGAVAESMGLVAVVRRHGGTPRGWVQVFRHRPAGS